MPYIVKYHTKWNTIYSEIPYEVKYHIQWNTIQSETIYSERLYKVKYHLRWNTIQSEIPSTVKYHTKWNTIILLIIPIHRTCSNDKGIQKYDSQILILDENWGISYIWK